MDSKAWCYWVIREETPEFEVMAWSKKPTYSNKLVLGLLIQRLNEIYEKMDDGNNNQN
jgi:hypothetical protein